MGHETHVAVVSAIKRGKLGLWQECNNVDGSHSFKQTPFRYFHSCIFHPLQFWSCRIFSVPSKGFQWEVFLSLSFYFFISHCYIINCMLNTIFYLFKISNLPYFIHYFTLQPGQTASLHAWLLLLAMLCYATLVKLFILFYFLTLSLPTSGWPAVPIAF